MRPASITATMALILAQGLGPGQAASRPDTHRPGAYVEDGVPRLVIVAPDDGTHATEVAMVAEALRNLTGVTPGIASDESSPDSLLVRHHVVSVGTVATNRFHASLYRRGFSWIDLDWPGPGGHVVRTTHDPLGTGRDVVWVSGSDPAGVAAAARAFAERAQIPRSSERAPLSIIAAGPGAPRPPAPDRARDAGAIATWRDSRRVLGGTTFGYSPGTDFGWNPISLAGALFHMTGDRAWLDEMLALARPDPEDLPRILRESPMFGDPRDPIASMNYYGGHMFPLVLDLVDDGTMPAETLQYLRDRLRALQERLDADDDLDTPHGSRHTLYRMLTIYTGSRYLAKVTGDPRWSRRVENVRRAFRSFIGDPTLATGDSFHYLATSIEPVFDFYLLDGPRPLVESGTARALMNVLETAWSGSATDEATRYASSNVFFKAAFLTGDGRYLAMRERLGFEEGLFRAGPSFRPAIATRNLEPGARISVAPVAPHDLARSGAPVERGKSFQFASYRAGPGPRDPFLLLDGFFGGGRHAWHVDALLRARDRNGRWLVAGHENRTFVRTSGLVDSRPPLAAELAGAAHAGPSGWLSTEVEEPGVGTRRRDVLLADGSRLWVVDDMSGIDAAAAGKVEALTEWVLPGEARTLDEQGRGLVTSRVRLDSSSGSALLVSKRRVVQRRIVVGDSFRVASVVDRPGTDQATGALVRVAERAFRLDGDEPELLVLGSMEIPGLDVDARIAVIGPERIVAFGLRRIVLDGAPLIEASAGRAAADMSWSLADGTVHVGPGSRVTLRSRSPVLDIGETDPGGAAAPPGPGLARSLRRRILEPGPIDPGAAAPALPDTKDATTWRPDWSAELNGSVALLAADGDGAVAALSIRRRGPDDVTDPSGIASPRGGIARLAADGRVTCTAVLPSEPTALDLPAAGRPALLAGLYNDELVAFDGSCGVEWTETTGLAPEHVSFGRHRSRWFTDPRLDPSLRGVASIRSGVFPGAEESIVVGRASTIELRRSDGRLTSRIPVEWGTVSQLAEIGDPGGRGRELLAAKRDPGRPSVTAVREDGTKRTDDAYSMPAPQATLMHAWRQRGSAALLVADVDGDGSQEVVHALTGHWNELSVYRPRSPGRAAWTRSFGPSAPRSSFLAGVALVRAPRGRGMRIVTGSAHGHIHAFEPDGSLAWVLATSHAVTHVATVADGPDVAVATAGQEIYRVDSRGEIAAITRTEGAVTALVQSPRGVLAGTESGAVLLLPPGR